MFWQKPDAWAQQDWKAAETYIGRFRPTAGFSVDDAQAAQFVTIVGGPAGVPAEAEQQLRAAGCQVERLAGVDYADTKRILDTLAEAAVDFRTSLASHCASPAWAQPDGWLCGTRECRSGPHEACFEVEGLLMQVLAEHDALSTPYVVKLPLFEGPLDLLLHLIQKNESDITVISLGLVADQFVEHLHGLAEVRAEVIADFLVVAAKLLPIKSRLLLPRPPAKEEDDEEDPGEALACGDSSNTSASNRPPLS